MTAALLALLGVGAVLFMVGALVNLSLLRTVPNPDSHWSYLVGTTGFYITLAATAGLLLTRLL